MEWENKIHEKEENVMRVQWEKGQELEERRNVENIKRMDRKENVERIQRMQDYQREKLLERIHDKMDKAEHIKAEK